MIVTVSGFIGSGKDTVSEYLQSKYQFKQVSFAGSLKDAISAIFGWDREMLEGRTAESRQWRETPDSWWSQRLGTKITPRWVLQFWGTEVCRQGFHDDIWIASLEHKLLKKSDNVVISDARFPNELATVRKVGGKSIRVVRGNNPDWYGTAIQANQGDKQAQDLLNKQIHSSEWAWIGYDFDHIIDNNQDLNSLYNQVDQLITNQILLIRQ